MIGRALFCRENYFAALCVIPTVLAGLTASRLSDAGMGRLQIGLPLAVLLDPIHVGRFCDASDGARTAFEQPEESHL